MAEVKSTLNPVPGIDIGVPTVIACAVVVDPVLASLSRVFTIVVKVSPEGFTASISIVILEKTLEVVYDPEIATSVSTAELPTTG